MINSLAVVTGAHGFLGRHTARYFAQRGWDVIGMGHGGWSQDEWRRWGLKEWHPCDISLETLLVYAREPDVIVHCAGSGLVGFSVTHPMQDYRRSVETTLSVLEFIRLHSRGTRVVLPSSAAVYGIVEQMPIKEEAELHPVSPYGVHKRIAEELCRSYSRHFGVSAAIIRFFSIYGPELRKQLLWDACRRLTRQESTFPGSGTEIRDWLYVKDAAGLFFLATEHAAIACPVVNGGCGAPITVGQVLVEIVEALGLDLTPCFTGISRPGDPKNYQADISRARGWGWIPTTDWRSGVREYVTWFKGDMR